jgi:deazaflavin-dependent oxidoreductase (nitroreductase family)
MPTAASHTPFAVFNRTANPVIRAVLRSPLHPLLSRRLALITVTGRKTARTFTFPVGYERAGDTVRIGVGWPERKRWWRNLLQEGRVEMVLGGKKRSGTARATGDERSGVVVEVTLDT